MAHPAVRLRRVYTSGALAGAATVLLFTVVHQFTISNIWFSVAPMLVIGALCGMAMAGSYRAVFDAPAPRSWVAYNAAYLTTLVLMGLVSIAVFDPITTSTALMDAGGPPPDELFQKALPFTALFTVVAAAGMSALWGRSLFKGAAILATTMVLVFLFGLNVSILGLVEMSGEGYRALAEFFGLTILVLAGNTGFFLLLERRGLFGGTEATEATAATEATEATEAAGEGVPV